MPHSLAFAELDLAAVLSVAALVIALLSYRRAGAADRRDRVRHDLELTDRAASKRAKLDLDPKDATSGDDGMIEAPVLVRNIGNAAAHDVRVWLVGRDDDERHSDFSAPLGTLTKDDEPVRLHALLPGEHYSERDLEHYRWRVAWTDDEGRHEVTTDRRPPAVDPDPPVIY